jgi:hypothetical protein
MQASWTAAQGAGSARFSSNLRDPTSYVEHSWAIRDRPWWMPEPAARVLFDSMDLSPATALLVLMGVSAVIAAFCHTVITFFVDEFRHQKSKRAARQLISEEKASKAAAAATVAAAAAASASPPAAVAATAGASESAAASGLVVGSGTMTRFCRFCDVQVDDEHTEAHEAGKRHRKLKSAAGALATGSTCWTWRPVAPVKAGALQESAPDADAAEPSTGARFPSAVTGTCASRARGGKAKGQVDKWSKVPEKRRR